MYGSPRTGLLRTFWEPDRVPKSPHWDLCLQGALTDSCPTRRAFLCLSGTKYASQKRSGLKTQFSIRHFRAGIRRSTRFETQIRPAVR